MNDPSVSAPLGDDREQLAPDVVAVNPAAQHDVTQHDAAELDAGARDAAELDAGEPIDLDAIERDLTDVQAALERLNDGSYWTDEVTGDALPDDVLTSYPLTRTIARSTATGSTST